MMNSAQTAIRRPHFSMDTRGAIAVFGIMIGAILAAVLFHLMNCGFGILWRERAQDAADAAAYETALWNARGMNTIVAINIFIALAMAVLIFWRLCICFMMAVTALATVACPFQEYFCPLIPSLTNGVTAMLRQDPTIAGRVYQVIAMLHDSQKVVAAASPVMGTLSSVAEAKRYGAQFGVGFGTQLVPTAGFTLGKKPNKSCRPTSTAWSTLTGDPGDRLGRPVSLPVVESNDLPTLCGQGGKMQALLLFGIVSKVGETLHIKFLKELGEQSGGGKFGNIWSAVTSAGFPLFCGDFMGSVDKLAADAVNSRCGNDSSCKNKALESQTEYPLPALKGKIDTSKAQWTDIWPLAANGNLFMQSWSYVKSDRNFFQGLDQSVRIADFLHAGSNADSAPDQPGDGAYRLDRSGATIAQAEMYFDCKSAWLDADCLFLAPWAMAWRARLRRVHDPVDMVASDVESTLVAALYGGLDGHFLGAVAEKLQPLGDALAASNGRLVQIGPSDSFRAERDKLARELVPAASDGSSAGVRSAAAWVADETAAGIPELIH